ncbi:hypothetical protein PILCRDRAFT_823160 [Piloderma croceum F 1598]|uniref:Uncharacterized protein n=1 Tax=Piloderma croceum (strain F 1598) TaxID=765440 RepID=A0A0C3B067_PILCF|nr:hypothetical protein PILCRDRAFT_823160 [Piloderma croceum F 1598]
MYPLLIRLLTAENGRNIPSARPTSSTLVHCRLEKGEVIAALASSLEDPWQFTNNKKRWWSDQ